MRIRKLHRAIGLVLLLPFLGWTLTGLVFFIKPGYEGAFELLQPRTYPLDETLSIRADPTWLEFRCLRTILGSHLLVRTSEGWLHLDPASLRPKDKPTEDEIRSLLADAFSSHPQRYGNITSIANSTITTDTNTRIALDWNRLSLQQRGTDTDRIDLLYRIHYLQWTGVRVIDRILGPLGLAMVLSLSILGVCLAKGSARLK
ncbi:MAG TPA: hypothetical protein VGV87_05245 [Blastocatellia bacterium]|jgi:hypothetical protein|nr:hypothetical protein [Blastocatellia bacterium]